ncbi:MAG: hypothetical protein DMG41_28930 [Acidobacteria bacterium]|nr:MAG: hypothetical protein AUH13_11235 [Acidobacteria bacterium 13_2_20CM_58_27]PYT77046.1 MAG: hypothetical protein DMG42_03335 [Acidobacteriota bacterium]PYT83998.1 MAG: hypothetical protein DMG41_28930 [Acidobacteriota bacterium]
MSVFFFRAFSRALLGPIRAAAALRLLLSRLLPATRCLTSALGEALEEAWNWLVNEGMLMRVTGQPDEWYKIALDGKPV